MGLWISRQLVLRGTRHDNRGTPSQDAAFASSTPTWRVFAVSDGVGSMEHSEVGAQLVARLASLAALDHVERGGAVVDVPRVVRARLAPVLVTLAGQLGPAEAKKFMAATLVLCVASDDEVAAWRAGDGEASLVGVPPGAEVRLGPERLALGPGDRDVRLGGVQVAPLADGLRSLTWREFADSRKQERVRDLPMHWLTGGADLAPVFHATGLDALYHGVYVASDGLTPAVRDLLQAWPAATTDDVRRVAERRVGVSTGDDDLGVAWGGDVVAQTLRAQAGAA